MNGVIIMVGKCIWLLGCGATIERQLRRSIHRSYRYWALRRGSKQPASPHPSPHGEGHPCTAKAYTMLSSSMQLVGYHNVCACHPEARGIFELHYKRMPRSVRLMATFLSAITKDASCLSRTNNHQAQ